MIGVIFAPLVIVDSPNMPTMKHFIRVILPHRTKSSMLVFGIDLR